MIYSIIYPGEGFCERTISMAFHKYNFSGGSGITSRSYRSTSTCSCNISHFWTVVQSCQYFQKIFLPFLLNKNISWQIPIIFQYERDMRGYRQGQWLLIRPNLLCLLFWSGHPASLSPSSQPTKHLTSLHFTSISVHQIRSETGNKIKCNFVKLMSCGRQKYQVGGAVYLDDYSFFVGWVGNFTSFTSHFR